MGAARSSRSFGTADLGLRIPVTVTGVRLPVTVTGAKTPKLRIRCARFSPIRIARILSTTSATKAPEIMASKFYPEPVEAASPEPASAASPANREAVSFDAFGQDIARRRAAAGDPVVPRNAGNRTASKRALLKAIEEAGGKW